MSLCVFTIAWQEARMMLFFLRHYSTIADKIVVFLEPSNDDTADIVKACPKAELRKWPHRGLDDVRFQEAVNGWYQEARGKFDWVCWPDVDELLWHPNMKSILEKSDGDIFPSTGYALISQTGWPDPQDSRQLYEIVKTGMRQTNYDKMLLHRSSLNVVQAIGRHVYLGSFPKHDGKLCSDVGVKLFHCHHVGGTEPTAERNRRNYARAIDKKHAWNFAPGHNDNPNQSGSVAWVKAAIEQNKLIDVFTGGPVLKSARRIQLGSGGLNLPKPFENFDRDVDFRKPLPFPNNSCSHVVMSHCLEHITFQQAWNCISECRRILTPGGVLRVAIPDLAKMRRDMTAEYQEAVKKGGHGDGSIYSALKACVFSHGHESVWTQELLTTVLDAHNFKVRHCAYGQSTDPVLMNCDMHWQTVGENVAKVETSICEGVK